MTHLNQHKQQLSSAQRTKLKELCSEMKTEYCDSISTWKYPQLKKISKFKKRTDSRIYFMKRNQTSIVTCLRMQCTTCLLVHKNYYSRGNMSYWWRNRPRRWRGRVHGYERDGSTTEERQVGVNPDIDLSITNTDDDTDPPANIKGAKARLRDDVWFQSELVLSDWQFCVWWILWWQHNNTFWNTSANEEYFKHS